MDIEDQPGRHKRTELEPVHEATCQKFPDIGRANPISAPSSLDDERLAAQSLVAVTGRAVLIAINSHVHQLFEAQAARTPAAAAVVCEGETWSYQQLNAVANRMAHTLRRMEVGTGTRVGVFLERSPVMAGALLGILKAGAAYVPLDPLYPAERIASILDDAGVAVLLTQQSLLETLGPVPPRLLCVDRDWPEMEREAPENLALEIEPEALAYVIYTSGSTGKPKGVQIAHHALANFLQSMQQEPGLQAEDRLLAVTTLSFDIAGLELFLPLICGARVILVPWHTTADGRALAQVIEEQAVTVMQATPTTWRVLLESGWPGRAGLTLLCGGEPLPQDLARQLLPRCAALWNMYGPTETTIWSTCCRVQDAGDIHIGQPIANTEIYILDEQQQPVPVGMVGELLIGGAGLARGYFNRPELTADKFIAHPYQAGARLYRTGDLARCRLDGNIECLGRLDFQVKIRGFRIELGEIEACLARHPAVKHCVVVVREDKLKGKLLAAYFEPYQNSDPSVADLRVHLEKDLPDYMIPAAFVTIQQMPLLLNGKIDRKALPSIDASSVGNIERVVPRNETEQRLAGIFSDVLRLKHVGANENFFDLGGHSLLAVRLMTRIEREFGKCLPLVSLFTAPTVRDLAKILMTEPAKTWSNLVSISVSPGSPSLFLVHGAGGNVLLYRELARVLTPDISLYGFQSQGLDQVSRPLESIEDMAAQYVSELRSFQPSGPYHLGGYCMGGTVAYEMARILRKQGVAVKTVALFDTYNLNLAPSRGSLSFRFSVWRQWLSFHLANIRHMDAGDRLGYLMEKVRMADEAVRGQLLAHAEKARLVVGQDANDPSVIQYIQQVNDRAVWAFKPQPCPGPVTVFKPKKNYDFMSDSLMGWGGLVCAGLEIVEVPANPHAMLIEPFVQALARELRSRILVRAATSVA